MQMTRDGTRWQWRWMQFLVALLVVALIAVGLMGIYHSSKERHRLHAEREVQLISQLQLDILRAWRAQRHTDAVVLSDTAMLGAAVSAWLHPGTLNAERSYLQSQFERDLRTLQEQRNYNAAYLVDSNGQVRLSASGVVSRSLPVPEARALKQAFGSAQPAFVEPRQDETFAFPFFSVLAPIYNGSDPVGAIWLVVDVRASLFPILERWPSGSTTAESFLAVPEGDHVLIISPLRHASSAMVPLRLSMSDSERPAVRAVKGMRGIFHAVDYRGEPVIAFATTVPNSPWYLISKMDLREALATDWREIMAMGLPILMGLLAGGLVLVYLQRQAWRRERDLKQTLERTLRWLENAQKAASVGYFAYRLTTREFSASKTTREIFGLIVDMPMSLERWLNNVQPLDRRRVAEAYRRTVSQRIPLHIRHRIIREVDRQERWVETWGEFEADPATKDGLRLVGTIQDITDRKHIEEELERAKTALEAQVRRDPLTGIANRLALDEYLEHEWRRAVRAKEPLSLLMIDVDHFKHFNDEYGHVAGDQCLRQVAQVISSVVRRSTELVARYGGEEFVAVLPDTVAGPAAILADRVRQAMRAEGIEHKHPEAAGVVTLSIGVVCVRPQPADDVSVGARLMLERADLALYEAKNAGRDRVALFNGGTIRVVAGGDAAAWLP